MQLNNYFFTKMCFYETIIVPRSDHPLLSFTYFGGEKSHNQRPTPPHTIVRDAPLNVVQRIRYALWNKNKSNLFKGIENFNFDKLFHRIISIPRTSTKNAKSSTLREPFGSLNPEISTHKSKNNFQEKTRARNQLQI